MISKKGRRDSGIYPLSYSEEPRLSLVFAGKVKPAHDLYRLDQITLCCCYLFTSVRQPHQPNLRYPIFLH